MVPVCDDQRQASRHVAANEQYRRERLALVNPLEVVVHVRFVAREKRQMGLRAKGPSPHGLLASLFEGSL